LGPAVLFTTVYMALTYGIYYSFFVFFPLVFRDLYRFGLGEIGPAFLSILTGLAVAVVLLLLYIRSSLLGGQQSWIRCLLRLVFGQVYG
jgi:MFS transporter, DHA1 family, multidrug resistance protein